MNARYQNDMHTLTARSSYDPHYYAPLFAVEDRHFWFRSRNEVIRLLVKQLTVALAPGYRVLEVGCGTGNVLRVLESACSGGIVVGMDLFADGLAYARRRTSCALVQADVGSPPFDTRFQLIGLFDVLEHLADDRQTLRDLHALLADDGALVLTIPASMSLWSYFDEASHHCRRYELPELTGTLRATGFHVEYITNWMMPAFPLLWLGRRLAAIAHRRPSPSGNRSRDLAESDLRIIPVINDVLAFALRQEARVIARRGRLPIGSSLLAIARKASSV